MLSSSLRCLHYQIILLIQSGKLSDFEGKTVLRKQPVDSIFPIFKLLQNEHKESPRVQVRALESVFQSSCVLTSKSDLTLYCVPMSACFLVCSCYCSSTLYSKNIDSTRRGFCCCLPPLYPQHLSFSSAQ